MVDRGPECRTGTRLELRDETAVSPTTPSVFVDGDHQHVQRQLIGHELIPIPDVNMGSATRSPK
jgi:hypothetical protein